MCSEFSSPEAFEKAEDLWSVVSLDVGNPDAPSKYNFCSVLIILCLQVTWLKKYGICLHYFGRYFLKQPSVVVCHPGWEMVEAKPSYLCCYIQWLFNIRRCGEVASVQQPILWRTGVASQERTVKQEVSANCMYTCFHKLYGYCFDNSRPIHCSSFDVFLRYFCSLSDLTLMCLNSHCLKILFTELSECPICFFHFIFCVPVGEAKLTLL